MKSTRATLLLHPVFIISLSFLLLNDLHWKAEYHNWLTGKLSDFAGMVVLPVALRAFFRSSKAASIIITAVFFCWWKSPLSQPLIDFLHTRLSLPVSRVVDGTDLLALAILPLTIFLRSVRYSIKAGMQTALTWCAGGLTIVALCATTAPYRYGMYGGYRQNIVTMNESFNSEKTKEEILQHLAQKGLPVSERQFRYYPHRDAENLYYRVGKENDSTAQWLPVPHTADSVIYLRQQAASPFYVLPFLVLNGDTLRNIEFAIYTNDRKKKKSTVTIEAFQTTDPDKYKAFYDKQRKPYKKAFEELFLSF